MSKRTCTAQIALRLIRQLHEVARRHEVVVRPRQVCVIQKKERAHGTLHRKLAHVAVALWALVIAIAEPQVAAANVGQLRLSLRDEHDIALLLQQREPHSVHISLLLLYSYLVAGRWSRIRQGRLNLLVQELLDLLWSDRNAEVPVRERGQFLVDKDLA